MSDITQFDYLHLENAKKIMHPFGIVYELLRDETHNMARVQITDDRRHYHKEATEWYHFISGLGRMELNGHVVDVRSGTSVVIPPRTRHRAWSENSVLDILVVSSPPYNPNDEFYD